MLPLEQGAGIELVKNSVLSIVIGVSSLLIWRELNGFPAVQRWTGPAYTRLGIPAYKFTSIERSLINNLLVFYEDVTEVGELVGMDVVMKEMRKLFKMSILAPKIKRESMITQGRGLLLYGPPGTGKTTVAKIIAKENKCFFLRISADVLRHSQYGKTEKTVAAIFSLASKLWKLQKGEPKCPTILFMDEVESILGDSGHSHEAFYAARSIFAQKWDGLEKVPGTVVIGTTNCPDQLPGFIYRRFQTRLHVPLPSLEGRKAILRKYIVFCGYDLALMRHGITLDREDGLGQYIDKRLLSDQGGSLETNVSDLSGLVKALQHVLNHDTREDVERIIKSQYSSPLRRLAQLTAGYSGSDLKDVVHHGLPDPAGVDKLTEYSLLWSITKVQAHSNFKTKFETTGEGTKEGESAMTTTRKQACAIRALPPRKALMMTGKGKTVTYAMLLGMLVMSFVKEECLLPTV